MNLYCILLGLVAGVFGGLFGIGGGIIIIPSLIYLLGFSQKEAQGTSTAFLVLPVGILAAINYYKDHLVDLKVAGLLALGFFVGGYFGSKVAVSLPEATMKRIFGVFLLIVSLRMVIWSK